MPDGDIIKIKLSGYYRKAYKMICEGKWDDLDCAREISIALKKQIQKAGDLVIEVSKTLGTKISQNSHLISERSHELKKIVNNELMKSGISPYNSGILNSAVNSLIHDLKYGKITILSNLPKEMIDRYISITYKSSFTGVIHSAPNDDLDAPFEKIVEKTNQIAPTIKKNISSWTSKLIQGESVKKLRRLPIKGKEINLEENLL